MTKKLKFIKESDSAWFIDLPEWEGSKADLAMVQGADTLLDILAHGDREVNMCVSTEGGFDYSHCTLDFIDSDDSGANYTVSGNNIGPFNVWLCNVTKHVFGDFPKKIHFITEY